MIYDKNIAVWHNKNITNGGVSAIETISNSTNFNRDSKYVSSTADVGAGEISSIERFYRAGLPDTIPDIDVAGFFGSLAGERDIHHKNWKVNGYGGGGY